MNPQYKWESWIPAAAKAKIAALVYSYDNSSGTQYKHVHFGSAHKGSGFIDLFFTDFNWLVD